jgi:lysophospholipase L1-like esterase
VRPIQPAPEPQPPPRDARGEERDGSYMNRFDRLGLTRFSARQSLAAVFVCVLLLALLEGAAVRRAGEAMHPGVARTLVLAVGKPAGWLADRLPLSDVAHDATAWLSPDDDLGGGSGGFAPPVIGSSSRGAAASGIPPVTPESFDPPSIGAPAPPRRPLQTLLVTGDSMSMPLDVELARRLTSGGVHVIRDPHLGSGISNSTIVDWGKLSTRQVAKDKPDAAVIFIGANDGYSFSVPGHGQVKCCGVAWATIYAQRVRQMMNTYRRGGAARVYWITLPTPREKARQAIARTVNAAIGVAAEPWRSQVRVIDTVPIFTPGMRYRDSMSIDGQDKIVRESDGIHLNEAGSSLLADTVLAAVDRDFTR